MLLAWCANGARALAADEAPAVADVDAAPSAGPPLAGPPLACLGAAAMEQNDPARLLDLALSCYEAEEYEAALGLLERLRTIDPNPVVLFNLGATHAALGHCSEARLYYEQYLEQSQSESGKVDARAQLETLSGCANASPSAELAAKEPAPAPAASLEPASAPQSAVMVLRSPQPVSEGAPYSGLEMTASEPPSRLASWILFGSSAALLVASGGFAYASERAEHDEGRSQATSGDSVADAQADGRRYNTLAWACAGGALALATSGLLLLAFEPSPDVTAARTKPLTTGAWSLRLQHRF